MNVKWNLGEILDVVDDCLPPDHPTLIHENRIITRSSFAARSNSVARSLLRTGVKHGDKVAFYLHNGPEYIELLSACLKARFVHVNVNYRYKAEELIYILNNSDAVAIAYDKAFRDTVAQIAPHLPNIKTWIEVGGQNDEVPDFAHPYESMIRSDYAAPLEVDRSPDDQIFVYTGGTTGMPKGVIWTHDLLMQAQLQSLSAINGINAPESMDAYIDYVRDTSMHVRQLPAAPLMHATGMTTALATVLGGGCVVTLTSRSFDPVELWETTEKHGVTAISIVGDVFAKPMLSTLDENPNRFNLSSVKGIVSSGVMWSLSVKKGLLKHMPDVTLLDALGSSEAPAMGASVTTNQNHLPTSEFRLSENCRVFDEHDQEIPRGSNREGFLARSGIVPLGYYKDEEKTKRTFRVIDGVRYVIAGDLARVEADGRLTLLGRDSSCINTGGEKVFSEEVEEILKELAGVDDALVVGIPDERWGQAVTAVITLESGAELEDPVVKKHVRGHLAGYKVPKHVVFSGSSYRFPNGKADYSSARQLALSELGQSAE